MKLECDARRSNFAFNFYSRLYNLEANRDNFEPFIEDDEKWEVYIARMSEDGTWAGNMELQAASSICMVGESLRTSTRSTLNRENGSAPLYEHSH